jgi:hypothetical protein
MTATATYTKNLTVPSFESSGWNGPGVVQCLATDLPLSTVYAKIDLLARATGWSPGPRNSPTQLADIWSKLGPEGVVEHLDLDQVSCPATASGGNYRLQAG